MDWIELERKLTRASQIEEQREELRKPSDERTLLQKVMRSTVLNDPWPILETSAYNRMNRNERMSI